MKVLRNLSIRNKLGVILLVPLVALFYYLGKGIIKDLDNNEVAKNISLDATLY